MADKKKVDPELDEDLDLEEDLDEIDELEKAAGPAVKKSGAKKTAKSSGPPKKPARSPWKIIGWLAIVLGVAAFIVSLVFKGNPYYYDDNTLARIFGTGTFKIFVNLGIWLSLAVVLGVIVLMVMKSPKARRYLRELKSEFKKIVWPTIPQTIKNTGVTLVMCAIVAAYVVILDLVMSKAVDLMMSFGKAATGG